MLKEKGHKSVGVIIRNQKGAILMMERIFEPFGWACPAGHIDKGESPEDAMIRETKEETNLDIKEYKLLLHEYVEWNNCRSGAGHDWFLFEALSWCGNIEKAVEEAREIKWIAPADLKKYQLEEVWKHWFEKLGVIKK